MTENPFQAMTEMMKKFQAKAPGGMSGTVPGVLNKEDMMKAHKRNMETLTEANKMAVEVMRSIATLQSQYIKKTFEDMSEVMKDVMKPDNSKEGLRNRNAHIQDQMHRAFDHTANVNNILSKTQREMFDRMYDRYNEGAEEMIDVTKKAARTRH